MSGLCISGFWALRVSLSAALLVAALLKGWSGWTSLYVGGFPFDLSPLVIACQVSLSLFLLTSTRLVLLWFVGLVTLGCGIVYHLYAVQSGEKSTGGFESIEIPHGTYLGMLGITMIAWACLKPSGSVWKRGTDRDAMAEGIVFSILAIGVIATLFLSGFNGGTPHAVQVIPSVIELGELPPMIPVTFSVQVDNSSSDPVTLVGGGVNCGCLTLQQLPLVIPANSSVLLEIELVPSAVGNAGEIQTQPFQYYLDSPKQFTASGIIRYSVGDEQI